MHAPPNLPDDVESLKQLILEQRALLLSRQVEIDKLKVQLARLRRLHFGRSSEQLAHTIEQLELSLEELEASETMLTHTPRTRPASAASQAPVRRPLPPICRAKRSCTRPVASVLSAGASCVA